MQAIPKRNIYLDNDILQLRAIQKSTIYTTIIFYKYFVFETFQGLHVTRSAGNVHFIT